MEKENKFIKLARERKENKQKNYIRRSLEEMIKQENKRSEERRQIETKFETKRRLEEKRRREEERIRQEEFRKREEEYRRQEEFRREEEIMREEEFRRREEEYRRQEKIMREQYMIRQEIMREQYMMRLEEFRRIQEEMYIQERMIREQEMIRRENELRRQELFRRRPYSVIRRPEIRSPIFHYAQMENQMLVHPIYRRREGFENREVNPNDILNKFAVTKLKNINSLNDDSKNCIICLEDFKKNDKVIYLPCIHFFHEMCIKNWIKEKQFCPVCKLEINNNLNN